MIRRFFIGAAGLLILVCWLGANEARAQQIGCSPAQLTVSMSGGAVNVSCFGVGASAGMQIRRLAGTARICNVAGFNNTTGCALNATVLNVQLRDPTNTRILVLRDDFAIAIPRQVVRRIRDQLQKVPQVFVFAQCYMVGADQRCGNVNINLGGADGPLAVRKMFIYAKYPGDNEKHHLVRVGFSPERRECRFYVDIAHTGEGTLMFNMEVFPPTALSLENEDVDTFLTPQLRSRQRRGIQFGRTIRRRLVGGSRTTTFPLGTCSEIVDRFGPGRFDIGVRLRVRRDPSGLIGAPNIGIFSLATGPGGTFDMEPAALVAAIPREGDDGQSFAPELKFDSAGRPAVHWKALGDPQLVVRVDITNASGQTVSIIAPSEDERLALDDYTPGATVVVSVLGPDRSIVIPATTVSPGPS